MVAQILPDKIKFDEKIILIIHESGLDFLAQNLIFLFS